MSKLLLHRGKKILASVVGVLGISSLTAMPAVSQQLPNNPANPSLPTNRVNTNRSDPTQNGRIVGGNVNYPYGSRVDTNGNISTPTGERTIPSVTVNHGDGSTSYYYRNGSSVTIDPNKVPPTGKLIRNR